MPMANRAYIGIWTRGYSEAVMLDHFERLLGTVPLSPKQPGFTGLVIRAMSPSEVPLLEQNLRGSVAGAAEVVALAREYRNADSTYEVEGDWDLWQRDPESGWWQRQPEQLLLICNGEAYDDGVAADSGHFLVDVGFEHRFTGHAGLLGSHETRSAPADPVEAEFLALMDKEEDLREYYEKTRENIQQLMAWSQAIEQALPVERYRLWSEGEVNLEARLDEILAVR